MPTIATRIYKELAGQIISGALAPGQKLEEKQLTQQFGASRTPIREALRELAARGFIELVPRRGGVVTRIGLDQLIDMLEAECEVEALCARLAAQRMTALEKSEIEAILAKLESIMAAGNYAAYIELNQELHSRICGGAHNATISAMTRELRDRLAPFRQSQIETVEERLTRSMREHHDIVNAIVAGNPEEAYEAMRRHNARLSVGVLNLLRGQYAVQNGDHGLRRNGG